MKKWITPFLFMSLILMASLLPSLSQAQIIFEEDFNTGGMPASFTLINNDGLTPAANVAYVTDAWIVRDDFIVEGDSCAFSTSWYTPAGTADDWMITPQINLTSNNVLEWEALAPDVSYADGYEVRLSTTTPTIAAFTNVLFTVGSENSTWTSRSIDLQAAGFSNQPVYIAWRNNSTDQFVLMVDSIRVSVASSGDAGLASTDSLGEYTIVPVDHLVTQNIGATVSNIGTDTLLDVHAKINIYDGTQALLTTLFTDTIASLVGLANGNVTLAGGWVPPSADFWILEYVVQHSVTDGNPMNDTAYQTLLVSDSTYARDDGQITGSLGIGGGGSVDGRLGQDWDLLTADAITSIGFFAASPDQGEPAAFLVYDFAGGVPNNVVATTDTIFFPSDTAGFFTIPITGGSVTLPPGKYATCIIEFDSSAAVATTTNIFTVGTTWVDWPGNPTGNWANNETFNFNSSYVIRPNFGLVCANPLAAFTSSSNLLTASFSDASSTSGTSTYLWDFGDGNTSTMQNPQHTYATPGTYTVCQTITDSCGSDSSCAVIQISCPAPTSMWSSSSNQLTVSFSDASSSASTVTDYLWDFGDGNTSTMAEPMYTYAAEGTYLVCLTVSDSCGTDSTCMNVTVSCPAPTAGFESQHFGNMLYNFVDISSTANTITSYMWDFGDGTTSTLQNPMHTYSSVDNFTVCLTITDSCGSDTSCTTLTITTGLSDEFANSIKVFPNPNQGQFTIDIDLPQATDLDIAVFDLLGKQINALHRTQVAKEEIQLDLSGFGTGIYLLQVNSEQGRYMERIEVIK